MEQNELPPDIGHPRGTLVIVAVMGILFALGWLGTYLYVFLERGAPHP
ncbi:MAG TPA: cytochrome c oxidase subunit 2A [Vicinamibacterales bacterium]|nr:cytochrome c oxidase subunit 2A [Vicinamibacterales bacterium]